MRSAWASTWWAPMAAWLACCAPLAAGFPWEGLFRRIDADPNKDYRLTPDQGPWLIMAATFSGGADGDPRARAEARAQARELVYELRSRYKMEAYTYEVNFRELYHGAPPPAVDGGGRPIHNQYRRQPGHEIAVLVGNYTSIDDPAAQRDLRRIKEITPETLDIQKRLESGKGRTYQQLAGWRLMQKTADLQALQEQVRRKAGTDRVRVRSESRQWGPMGSAFLTRNPLLPDDQPGPAVVDKFVYEMNRHVQYSLLDCPARYTVKVATFTGKSVVDPREIRAIQRGEQQLDSRLEQAAIRAHELTVALREKGYEAYEFHDRLASIVCVGSFDSIGVSLPDGTLQLDPRIQQVIVKFAPDVSTGGAPKTLLGIPFDVRPIPVYVPKRSLGADYAKGSSSR